MFCKLKRKYVRHSNTFATPIPVYKCFEFLDAEMDHNLSQGYTESILGRLTVDLKNCMKKDSFMIVDWRFARNVIDQILGLRLNLRQIKENQLDVIVGNIIRNPLNSYGWSAVMLLVRKIQHVIDRHYRLNNRANSAARTLNCGTQ
ncbi:hypothetical protein ACOME3_004284 [Neoechinorhynchus agilis]